MDIAARGRSAENRRASRLKSIIAAKIIYNHGNSTIDCTIRNMSDVGAKLSVSTVVPLPDQFDLSIPQKSTTRRAQIAWRSASEVGVMFVSASRTSSASEYSLRDKIRALEEEITRLQNRIRQLTEG